MNSPAFQFYADDFLAGVADMSQEEVGAYILLLCQQWNRGAIPSDADRQNRLAKGPVSPYVLEKFKPGADGMLRNERLEIVRKEQNDFREAKSQAGRKGNDKRWESHRKSIAVGSHSDEPAIDLRIPNHIANHRSPSPSPTPNTPLPPDGGMDGGTACGEPKQPKPGTAIPTKSEPQLRAERIFRRKPETRLDSSEERAWKKNAQVVAGTSEADWLALEKFYADGGREYLHPRKDLATLLNHWNGELEKAREWSKEQAGRPDRSGPSPAQVQKQIAEFAHATAKALEADDGSGEISRIISHFQVLEATQQLLPNWQEQIKNRIEKLNPVPA